jgi:hypothetical protein
MSKNRNTLTEGQPEALPEILRLLGLEQAKLTQSERIGLCERFHSIPYQNRTDDAIVSSRLQLLTLVSEALSRGEVKATIRSSAALAEQARIAAFWAATLIPETDSGGKE